MTTATEAPHDLQWFTSELRRRANAHYETSNVKRLLALPLSVERARLWALQMKFWLRNRRDCWAFAQALAPEDVKALIWEHERDELAGNIERDVEDHGSLHVRESANFGLTPADFDTVQIAPQTRIVTYAYIHLVKDSPWLKAVSACAALEISNSAEWVDGGGMSYRKGVKFERELGVPFDKQVNMKEHAEVDVDHAHMLLKIAKRHATTPLALELMLEGVIESWELDTMWHGLLVNMLEPLPAPR
jgi:pyrroloquinoline quinone (PQQ) biosynthesis protein C